MEQDEDLLLYDLQYFPVLLELVSDEKCPKSEYAFVILCQFCREVVVLHKIRGLKSLEKLSNFINSMKKPDSGYASSWFSYVNSLLAYIEQTYNSSS
ncbi:MAG: hypothetical protein GY714_32910 [Desulfobacterales bacterium]|nr:hypothetical protein [Desulfobacterales bacterium]